MSADLPTGVVTLVFTDIEGSTRLLAELRTGYVDALAEHRRILQQAALDHGGVVVDSQGDAMLLAFGRPADATAAAASAQRTLAGGPVRVRMGIHSGTPELRDDAYVGLDVHRGARIAAAGHGGQTLVSSATERLIDDTLVDLGRHWLKDLDEPEHVFQLVIDGLTGDFPALRTTEADRPQLPTWATSFVGREQELERLASQLQERDHRIISIVGPGGAGKTRLALEAAVQEWERSRRRVAFAPLVTVHDESQLVTALADAVGFGADLAHGLGSPEDQLVDYLRHVDALIVADNFEQLLPAAALLSRVAAAAPDVTLLVTSRARLDLEGEWVVDVGGLGADGLGDAATRLFVERARQRDPSLRLGDDEWADVARICRLTDSMPLALELAAGWLGLLTPRELADELEQDVDVLASRASDVHERHRSLRAAFEGSWRLLDRQQQRALAGLAVFRGPFARDAADEVVGVGLAHLADLASRSLVRRVSERFEIHDLIRRYALERLEEEGDAATIADRHARYFVDLVAAAGAALRGPASPAARARLQPDLADIRDAMAWAVVRWPARELVPGLEALNALWAAQVDPSGPATLRELARLAQAERDRTLDRGDVPLRTKLAGYLALSLASVDANEESDAVVEANLEAVRKTGDRADLALCLLAQGMNRNNRDENADSIPPLREADALFALVGDDLLRADTLSWLGWAHLMLDEIEAAEAAFTTMLELALDLGDPATIAFAQSKTGLLDDVRGRPAAALDRHLAAFSSFDAAGSLGGVGYSLSRASMSAYSLGDFRSALDFGQIAYEAFSDLGHRWGRTGASARIAFAYLGLSRPEQAREWGTRGLHIGKDGVRLGRLYNLSAIAAAYVAEGRPEPWLGVLRATVDDPDFPTVVSIQARHELARAEHAGIPSDISPDVDLDATIARLLAETAVSPAP